MSAPRKDELARGWIAAERLIEEDADRVAALGDEDFEREMRALPEPERVPSVDAVMARARRIAAERRVPPAPGPVASSPEFAPQPVAARDVVAEVVPIRRRWPWLLAAAAIAAVLAILFSRRGAPPDPWHSDDRFARAEQLRREATAACDAQRFAECEAKLDDAHDLDPAGESAPEVQSARTRIIEALAAEASPPRREPPPPRDEHKPPL